MGKIHSFGVFNSLLLSRFFHNYVDLRSTCKTHKRAKINENVQTLAMKHSSVDAAPEMRVPDGTYPVVSRKATFGVFVANVPDQGPHADSICQ